MEALTGLEPDALVDHVRQLEPVDLRDWLAERPGLGAFLDSAKAARRRRVLVSDHEDRVIGVAQGYGEGNARPDDYLESFGAWIAAHQNEVPALVAVLQRPASLSRVDLRGLALEMGKAGFTLVNLRAAWQEARSQDVAASLIGFIRAQALGSPLVPHDQRVRAALGRLLASHDWTGPQRQWLQKLARQITENTVVDRAALDETPFRQHGGSAKLDRVFEGRLDAVLGDLRREVWADAA